MKSKMKDIENLIQGTLRELASSQFKEMATNIQNNHKLFHWMNGRRTPEEIAAWEKKAMAERKQEQARLAAIQAAKTPAQRLKDKQDACDHEFDTRYPTQGYMCRLCGMKVTRQFFRGYEIGQAKGYEAGRESSADD